MSWRETLVCLFALVQAVAASAGQSNPVRSDQEILIQLERDWDEAFHSKNLSFVQGILADEFIATYDDGSRGDKARELALTAAFNQQVDSSTLDEFTVKEYGNTAVVWFSQHLTGISQGKPLALTFQYMDVFVLRDGTWKCVASQHTKVTGP